MKTVSFQGTQLTSGQRRRLQEQQQARSFVNPVLQQQVNETLAALEARQSLASSPNANGSWNAKSVALPALPTCSAFKRQYPWL